MRTIKGRENKQGPVGTNKGREDKQGRLHCPLLPGRRALPAPHLHRLLLVIDADNDPSLLTIP